MINDNKAYLLMQSAINESTRDMTVTVLALAPWAKWKQLYFRPRCLGSQGKNIHCPCHWHFKIYATVPLKYQFVFAKRWLTRRLKVAQLNRVVRGGLWYRLSFPHWVLPSSFTSRRTWTSVSCGARSRCRRGARCPGSLPPTQSRVKVVKHFFFFFVNDDAAK